MSMCRGFHFNLVEREANQSESVGRIKGRKRCSPRRGTKTRPEPENNHFAIAPGVIENGNFPSAATPHVETSQNLKWKTRSPARAECYANGSGPSSSVLLPFPSERSPVSRRRGNNAPSINRAFVSALWSSSLSDNDEGKGNNKFRLTAFASHRT
jgi:hypothetical protein